MIVRENYSEEHIRNLQKTLGSDPQLIERSLYAMGLLEALVQTGMQFIFKGGSCLMLLLPNILRLSTDIDIIVSEGTDVRTYLESVSHIFPFARYEEQLRIGKNSIKKQHFKFVYYSPIRQSEFYILLDILYEENNYAELVEKGINNEILLTNGEDARIKMPTIDCILGDKMTAFAPHTTGISIHAGKNLEVMKQFFDITTLIDYFENYDNVLKTYERVVASEISYRGEKFNKEDVIKDTIDAAVSIASRGRVGATDYQAYLEGIRGLSTHTISQSFNGEIASYKAPKIIYLSVCLLTATTFERVCDYEPYMSEGLTQPEFLALTKMKKANPMQYAYVAKADRLLREYRTR